MRIVSDEKQKKATKVPTTPKSSIFDRFAKKSPLYMLKPEANTIGGRQKKKKALSLNLSKFTTSLLSCMNSMYDMIIPRITV